MEVYIINKSISNSLISCEYGHCLFHHFGYNINNDTFQVYFKCIINTTNGTHKLIMSTEPIDYKCNQQYETIKSQGFSYFMHAGHCPVYTRPDHIISLHPGNLRVGVCVLIKDQSNRILLTRRNINMRSFPGAYVFPGGQVDAYESLEEAGVREVFEETGIVINSSSMKPLCLWESVYPPVIDMGPVRSHYVVFYYTCVVDYDVNVTNLKLSYNEVDKLVWIDYMYVNVIIDCDFDRWSLSNNHINHALGNEYVKAYGVCSNNNTDNDNNDNDNDNDNNDNDNTDNNKNDNNKNDNDNTDNNKNDNNKNDNINDNSYCIEETTVPLKYLFGTYPRKGEGTGIARGHLFALKQYMKQTQHNDNDNDIPSQSQL